MKGNLSRCLAFAICLLCFAAVGASIVFKWKKIASEDNAIWKLRADYDAWGRGNVFVRNMFAFNYAGDIPIECFKKYSSGSFSKRNYWNFITKKFNKYKEDFLKTLEVCQEITYEDCRKVSKLRLFGRAVLRVFAPLM